MARRQAPLSCRASSTRLPNGDLFLSDSQAGSIFALRGVTADGKAETVSKFASGLDHPFGIAFYPAGPDPKYTYVGTATEIVRFPYKSGELKAEINTPETIVPDSTPLS